MSAVSIVSFLVLVSVSTASWVLFWDEVKTDIQKNDEPFVNAFGYVFLPLIAGSLLGMAFGLVADKLGWWGVIIPLGIFCPIYLVHHLQEQVKQGMDDEHN